MPLCSVFAIQSRPEPWHMVDNITAGNHGGMTQSLLPGDFVAAISLLLGRLFLRLHAKRKETFTCVTGLLPAVKPKLFSFHVDCAGEVWVCLFLFLVVIEQAASVGIIVLFTHFRLVCFIVCFTTRTKVSGFSFKVPLLHAFRYSHRLAQAEDRKNAAPVCQSSISSFMGA